MKKYLFLLPALATLLFCYGKVLYDIFLVTQGQKFFDVFDPFTLAITIMSWMVFCIFGIYSFLDECYE